MIWQRLKGDLTPPFFALFGFILLYSVTPALLGQALPERARLIGTFISWFGFGWWLLADSRRMRITLPMVYGFLLFCCFPIFVPFYLFHTRGLMAFVSIGLYLFALLCIIAVCFLAYS